jgi:hypothetical protein
MISSRKLLDDYLVDLAAERPGSPHLRIFDFDDTLAMTNSKVKLVAADGSQRDLTPVEYCAYVPKEGERLSFEDFERLVDARPVWWTCEIMRQAYMRHGPCGIVVLSARHIAGPIQQFINSQGVFDCHVAAVGSSDPEAKVTQIDAWIDALGLQTVEYFEDSDRHVSAVAGMRLRHPDVRFLIRHVKHDDVSTLMRLR